MAKWSGEVSIMRQGKSYYQQPPTFVTVDAGTYVAACGAAVREAKKRMARGLRVEAVLVKVTRLAVAAQKHLEQAYQEEA